jgi:hypothetical protein
MGFLKHLIKGMYRDAYHHKYRHYENHDYDQRHRGSYGTGHPSSSGIFLSIKNFIRRNKKIVDGSVITDDIIWNQLFV